MTRLVAEAPEQVQALPPTQEESPADRQEAAYWLTPVASDDKQMAEEVIQTLVGDSGIYAFGERTTGRGKLKPRDWMCFYASGKGVVAYARVSSMPEKKPHQKVRHSDKYPWVFQLTQSVLYLDNPMVIDFETRTMLDAFKDRDPNQPWDWFVQGTRAINEHDFQIVTRQ